MKLKRLHSALIAAMLTCSMVVVPVFADPADDKAKLEGQKSAAEGELASLQKELNDIAQKANELELKLISTGEAIIQAEDDLKVAEETKKEQYEAMKKRIKWMYEAGTGSSTMEKVLKSGDMSDMLSQAEYSQKMHQYDREQLQIYANTVKEIETLQTTLKEEKKNLEKTEKEYEAQQATLSETISSKKDEISNLDDMIQEAARKAQEEAERKAAEEAARQEALNNSRPGNSGNNGGGNSGGGNSGGNSGGGTTNPTPNYNPSTGNAIVDRAYQWVNNADYSLGACQPGLFDCSGFVSYCLTGSYTRLGTTWTFMGWPRVSDPQPGDVCTSTYHCGIYIGNGQMIHAADYGIGVIIGPVQGDMIYVRR